MQELHVYCTCYVGVTDVCIISLHIHIQYDLYDWDNDSPSSGILSRIVKEKKSHWKETAKYIPDNTFSEKAYLGWKH